MMDIELQSQDENIRKIEDIIDIQKAKGNYNIRQVAFVLPSETESTVSAGLAKSLETGLSGTISNSSSKKKFKKHRASRHKNQMPDVVSWPSDSDITVLRMKLFDGGDLKEKVGNLIPGDGLHQPDSSSMVNLATLMLQSQPPSKHSVIEEYLMPLTSWEVQSRAEAEEKFPVVKEKIEDEETPFHRHFEVCNAVCNPMKKEKDTEKVKEIESGNFDAYSSRESGLWSHAPKKCKIARFLRLYFCPCCTCLYKMEKMKPSDVAKQHNL